MTIDEAKHKLDFMKKAYQKLIDEKVDSGKLVGDGVSGEWKTETPLDEAYKSMIDALEMAIEALEQQPCEVSQGLVKDSQGFSQETCEDSISRQAVIELCEGWWLGHTKEDDFATEIRALPSVNPQKSSWIPVSERLPEKRGCYIVTEKVFSPEDREHKGRYNTMVEQVEYYDGKWKRASFFEVVAWMPLPQPYKAESEDKE